MKPGSGPPLAAPRVPGWRIGWTAIRPRTLSLAVAPVVLGSALAWADGSPIRVAVFLAALVCALLIQIGTNLGNDVADCRRGIDGHDRVGPLRVTATGWVQPRTMVRASLACFVAALLIGLWLVGQGGWPILLAGITSLVAGWCYSAGPRPISHSAWGEAFVLMFFGLIAVAGSHWLQAGTLLGLVLAAGVLL